MTLLKALDKVMTLGEARATSLLTSLIWDKNVAFPIGDLPAQSDVEAQQLINLENL